MLAEVLESFQEASTGRESAEQGSKICVTCGSEITSQAEAARAKIKGEEYLFCSKSCTLRFKSAVRRINRLLDYLWLVANERSLTETAREYEPLTAPYPGQLEDL